MLIKYPAVKKINFTRLIAVSYIIAGLATKELKPVILKLKSKVPSIILDNTDLKGAASATTRQCCIAIRVILYYFI